MSAATPGAGHGMTLLSSLAGDPQIEALLGDEAQLAAMLAFERELAFAEAEAGLIAQEAATAIAAAIAGFAPDWGGLAAGFATDGVVVPALVKQIRATLPAAHRDALHKGATSQDVVDTALMLQLGRVARAYETRLAGVLERLATLAAAHGGRPLMAQTRMQRALPFTWRDKLLTWQQPLERHLQTLAAMRQGGFAIQLGGPVGDRASLDGHGDAVAAALARRLGLANAPCWHSQRDRVVGFGSLLSLISGSLGKIGADVALMAQNEIAAVQLTGGGSSSAMAHKSNPVRAEVLVALARFNAGQAGTLQQAMLHENERSGAAWTLEWLTLPAMAVTTGAALRLAAELLDQLVVDG